MTNNNAITDDVKTQDSEVIVSIANMPEEEQIPILTKIVNHLAQGYATQDYVRQIRVHPNDVEFITGWVSTLPMPDLVRDLVDIKANEGTHVEPGVILQSQIETEWLAKHYKDSGLVNYINAHNAPLMLTHKDLKLLFLLEGLRECEKSRNKILLPGI